MTTQWDSGYVSDIEYIPGYYKEQAASHIETICLANGIESSVIDGENFTYCELGCGLGETSLITAATAPLSQVYAFDFNPAHIAGARKLAKKCGINNVYFGEQSFKQLAEGDVPADMPLFDYVTLHGIWTWINPENRAYIVQFLSRHLKPSGIVYVSYNALPAYSSVIPMRNLFFMLANEENGPTNQRAQKAAEKIQNMLKDGALHLPENTNERLSKNPSYLSHEYLNASWDPTFHYQVADDLNDAKLSYFGSANLLENYPDYTYQSEQKKHIDEASPRSVETLADYFMNRFFRKDLFIRGKRKYPFAKAAQRINDINLQLCVPSDKFNYFMITPLGRIELHEDYYKPIVEALSKNGSMTIKDILNIQEIKDKNTSPFNICAVMLGSNQAVRVLPKENQADLKNIREINKILVEESTTYQRNGSPLVCATTGQAIHITDYEMFAYRALSLGCAEDVESLIKSVIAILKDVGSHVTKDGIAITDEAQRREIIQSHIEDIVRNSIPLWKNLGAF